MVIENKKLNQKTPITSVPSSALMYWLGNPTTTKDDYYITYSNLESQLLRGDNNAEFGTLDVSGAATFEDNVNINADLDVTGDATANTSFSSPIFKAATSAGGKIQTHSGSDVASWGGGGSTVFNVAAGMTIPDGTAATPALRFGSDTNTGIYRTGPDSFGMSSGGSLIAVVGSAGLALQPSSTTEGGELQILPGTNFTGNFFIDQANDIGRIFFNTAANKTISMFNAGAGSFALNVGGGITADSINFGDESLSEYDEGTFTPTFTFQTAGDLSVSYNVQDGVYTRIGDVVFCRLTLECTPTFTTASGAAFIGGLPFTVVNDSKLTRGSAGSWANINLGTNYYLLGFSASTGAATLTLRQSGDNNAEGTLAVANFASGTQFEIVLEFFYNV